MKDYIESYNKLSVNDKRDILLEDMKETLNTIESLCNKNKIKVDKLRSSSFIKNKEALFEEDYYSLLFIYLTYIKEDLALLMR